MSAMPFSIELGATYQFSTLLAAGNFIASNVPDLQCRVIWRRDMTMPAFTIRRLQLGEGNGMDIVATCRDMTGRVWHIERIADCYHASSVIPMLSLEAWKHRKMFGIRRFASLIWRAGASISRHHAHRRVLHLAKGWRRKIDAGPCPCRRCGPRPAGPPRRSRREAGNGDRVEQGTQRQC